MAAGATCEMNAMSWPAPLAMALLENPSKAAQRSSTSRSCGSHAAGRLSERQLNLLRSTRAACAAALLSASSAPRNSSTKRRFSLRASIRIRAVLRNDVGGAGQRFDDAHRGDEVALTARRELQSACVDPADDPRRGDERIAPQLHRGCARVARRAFKFDFQPGDAGDGGDDADVDSLRFEHRSLLDVQFEGGRDVVAPRSARRARDLRRRAPVRPRAFRPAGCEAPGARPSASR